MSDNGVYLGNPNLKKSNVAIEWTQDQVKEYLKCKEDPLYFVDKLLLNINYLKECNITNSYLKELNQC